MKKIIASLIAVGFMFATTSAFAYGEHQTFRYEQKEKRKTFWAGQKAENREFRGGLKNLPPEQRASAIAQHRKGQFSENKAFREKLHNENMTYLKDKLANNKKLNDAQKTDLINFMDKQYQENTSFRDQRHSDNMAFFQQVANDATLSQEQKKQAIRERIEKQKSENKSHWQEQKAERKDFKNSLKPQT